jgi:enolase-phosphatase E1
MIEHAGRGILLDVEGTTSSVSYVYDVLFPFARRELAGFLERSWAAPPTVRACERIARDAGGASLAEWAGAAGAPDQVRQRVIAEVERLMAADAKATGLKELQGLIWQEGYAAGRLQSHVYPDVAPALRRWRQGGRDVRIFSSGSVAAQRAFFANTDAGNLLDLLCGHYDTTIGPKREPASYHHIAADMNLPPHEVLFLSDVVAELDAAAAAGMAAALVVRPGNAPAPPGHRHPILTTFDEVVLSTAADACR